MLSTLRKQRQNPKRVAPIPKALRTSNSPRRLRFHESKMLWREQSELEASSVTLAKLYDPGAEIAA